MATQSWVGGPVGLDAHVRTTMVGTRAVLVMVPTMTAGTRLMDLVPLFDGDHRVQVVFTVPQADLVWHGLDRYATGLGGLVVPWDQALRHEWDLVLSASHRLIERVHGRLLLLPHGAGAAKSRLYSRKSGGARVPTTGLDRETLTYRGRVLPSAVGIPTSREMRLLGRTCPEAAPAAFLAGDICLDSLRAGLPYRERYRDAFGVGVGELVVVSSTWSPHSLFGRRPEFYERITRELPNATVAAVLHPHIWAVHGEWQVRSWLARARADGLVVVPPERGWQAAMVAADVVVGDHGSTTLYAAALGRRVCVAAWPEQDIRAGSPAAVLRQAVPMLDHARPLAEQLARVEPVTDTRVVEAVSSVPGHSHARFRTAMYDLLGLPEPDWPARAQAPLVPRLHRGEASC
ncbi:hypothetical protein [Actinokineospora enzanensis]|uniref:hypothetical protein n=1 Tax=Actinokineospora enzanensis TaxID=155975 RepID=UPI00037937BA|nr:hypothetical protein [Actinokineospora enzanensis]